jgi:hypothetical protein
MQSEIIEVKMLRHNAPVTAGSVRDDTNISGDVRKKRAAIGRAR